MMTTSIRFATTAALFAVLAHPAAAQTRLGKECMYQGRLNLNGLPDVQLDSPFAGGHPTLLVAVAVGGLILAATLVRAPPDKCLDGLVQLMAFCSMASAARRQ
jgi:hypothetical protein